MKIFFLPLICFSLTNFAAQKSSTQENSTNIILQKIASLKIEHAQQLATLKKKQIQEINTLKAQYLRETSPIQPLQIPYIEQKPSC